MAKLTTEEFIRRSKEVHGDYYDYSKVVYERGKDNVIITCPVHGDFLQTPETHLGGHGCPECGKIKAGNKQKTSQEDFIARAKAVHGGFYDYTKVKYVNTHTDVIITCPIHGDYSQTPDAHLHGCKCPKCAVESRVKKRTSTTEQFIEKARKKHGDKYDYSKVNYVNSITEVTIGCPEHGFFEMTPTDHLTSCGCRKCGQRNKGLRFKKTTEQFIQEARIVHGDYYDYSKVVYERALKPVIITCPVHGDFPQKPIVHLNGHGCCKCSNGTMSEKEFIEKARAKYGDRYDYSLVKITGNQTKVKIICPIHGIIEQKPWNHLHSTTGCYKCAGVRGFTTEDYIRMAKEIHGDRYDYSQTVYKSSLESVTVICKKHGPFIVNATNHLSHKQGCRICNLGSRTTEEFIEDARKVHGDKYDYSKSVYAGIEKPIIVTCKKHGDWETSPHEHLRGGNCPRCSISRGEERIEMFLKRHGIKYKAEKIIKSKFATGTKGLFKVDFWLPKQKMIIEYNGRQHYENVGYMGGEQKFAERQARDEGLRKHCEHFEINLWEIPYTDYDRLDEILTQRLIP